MPKKIGRIRQPTFLVKKVLAKEYSDSNAKNKNKAWHEYSDGGLHRYTDVFSWILAKKPIEHLLKINKKNPNILFLGPAKGEYIIPFKEELISKGKSPKIDVFGLFKETLSENVRKEITKDYSMETAFESLDPRNPNHRQLLLEMIEKYDLIMAPMSVTYQTNYPAFALYQSALMLSKNGKAYLEVRSLNSASLAGNQRIEKQLPQLEKLFNRFISIYNKKSNKQNKYNFKILGDINTHPVGVFVEIERIN